MQNHYRERTPLLDDKGRLTQPCWATSDVFYYNKSELRPHFRRKEWEQYLLFNTRFFLQLSYGHVGYGGFMEAVYVDLETGERYVTHIKKILPGDSMDLDFSPEQAHNLRTDEEKLFLAVYSNGGRRRIECRSEHLDVKLLCARQGDAVCTATPFPNSQQFQYSYKYSFRDFRGYVRLHGREIDLEDAVLVLNSTRAVLPYRSEWVWGAGAKKYGKHTLAVNIGWGLGSEDAATENALILNGKIHKLDRIWVDRNQDPMQPWRFQSNDGRFHVRFEPVYDRFTKHNLLLVNTDTHRVYGQLFGTVKLDDGRSIRVDGMPFFCEHARNRW